MRPEGLQGQAAQQQQRAAAGGTRTADALVVAAASPTDATTAEVASMDPLVETSLPSVVVDGEVADQAGKRFF